VIRFTKSSEHRIIVPAQWSNGKQASFWSLHNQSKASAVGVGFVDARIATHIAFIRDFFILT
jgi:hypothetical protein